MVPCLMRAGPHYKSQFGKGVLCPQSWHLSPLLTVVVLGRLDRLSCVSLNVLCRSNTVCFRHFTAVATSAVLTSKTTEMPLPISAEKATRPRIDKLQKYIVCFDLMLTRHVASHCGLDSHCGSCRPLSGPHLGQLLSRSAVVSI